jgi:small-conductance mechanosensitive channel
LNAVAQEQADPAAAPAASSVSPVETGKQVARGIGEATMEVGGAVGSGGASVVDQGRKLWQDAILPMLQRTTAAIPVLVKALVLLIGFWIVARLVGAGVTKALGLTHLDEKAARDWGLEGVMKDAQGKPCSLERFIGGVAKWIILLFGLVAFFNALNLQMVAGPLQNIVDRIVGIVPSLLKAFVILFAYWVVASVARIAVTKGLGAVKFDQRAGKYFPPREVSGQKIGPSALAGRLLFYIVLLFGIPPFLEALGQQALVAPLQDMLSKALAFIPNVIAAAIIVFIGNIVAVIVREVVSSFLAAAGADQAADRVGLGAVFGDKRLSGVVAIIAYFFILVPIVISALDALQITAISTPVKNTLEKVLAAVPALLVATVIIVIGYAVAKLVRRLVESLLAGIGFDSLPARLGLDFLSPRREVHSLSNIAGTIVMVVILLLTAQQALASLGFSELAGLLDRLVTYLPDLAVGLLILLAALSLGRYVGTLVAGATSGSPYSKTLAGVARYAIMFLGAGMALDQLGVSQQIVTTAVSAVLGGAALAVGLAFGLGGKDKARELIERGGS